MCGITHEIAAKPSELKAQLCNRGNYDETMDWRSVRLVANVGSYLADEIPVVVHWYKPRVP